MDEVSLLAKFGGRVREARLALGLSQEKFAFDCGLDRTYISSVERGKRNVSLVNIYKIARALGISPAELFAKKGGGR
jgi:transcriptional regulator with XRE-family HTH domain